jgi:amino acid transporter
MLPDSRVESRQCTEGHEGRGPVSVTGKPKIGLWSVVAIGVGGMVGGGIFAVLGLAVQLAGGGTPLAFLVAGAVALITSYSYAKLSIRYPSQGGTVVFLDRAFGVDLFTGSMNTLLWLSYIVMLALYAFAFGAYGSAFFPESSRELARHILVSAAIVLPTTLNLLSVGAIGRAESYIVGIKVAILLFFIAVGLPGIDAARVMPGKWPATLPLLAGGMLIFLAYEGFELMANAAEDVKDPKRTLPRSFLIAVLAVILLYVLVSLVTVGSLSVQEIVGAKDYALAEAAKPFLGSFGFNLIAIAALLSTLSAINATLYGSARLAYAIAKDGELPEFLDRKIWGRPVEGLLITAGLALVLANLGDLSSISMMGSTGFLLIFMVVNAANLVKARETRSLPALCVLGVAACLLALCALIWQTVATSPEQLLVPVGMLGFSILIEVAYRQFRPRKIRV